MLAIVETLGIDGQTADIGPAELKLIEVIKYIDLANKRATLLMFFFIEISSVVCPSKGKT
jgi:hypothetical protein